MVVLARAAKGFMIQLDGARELLFDEGAYQLARRHFDIGIGQQMAEYELDITLLHKLIWCGLQRSGPPLRLKVIKKLITPANHERYSLLLAKALCNGLGIPYGDVMKEEVQNVDAR